ncbi:MAG: DUF5082 domain-containing protein [Oscillospiraceae bacterium]|nr:DUF5082 domain-containing protein [Oscillospiraceae bacterium]
MNIRERISLTNGDLNDLLRRQERIAQGIQRLKEAGEDLGFLKFNVKTSLSRLKAKESLFKEWKGMQAKKIHYRLVDDTVWGCTDYLRKLDLIQDSIEREITRLENQRYSNHKQITSLRNSLDMLEKETGGYAAW